MPKQGLLRKYIDPDTTISNILAGIPAKKENKIRVVNYLIERIERSTPERIYLQAILKRKMFHPEKFLRKTVPDYVLTYIEKHLPNITRILKKIWKKDLQKRSIPEEKLVTELISNCVEILAKDTDFLNQLQDNATKTLRTLCRLIYEISDIVSFRKNVLQQELVSDRKQSVTHTENSIRTALELYRLLKGRKNRFYLICDELLTLIEKQTKQ